MEFELSSPCRTPCLRVSVAVLLLLVGIAPAADKPIDADVLLEGGLIHDGAGGEPITGDVALVVARRRATTDEVQRMLRLAEQAMREGAWGMSTGLIYVPSVYADTGELVEIATIVSEYGGLYASHIRGEGHELLDAVNEALD